MGKINKRPQVIRDLIDLATYIAEDNIEASDLFLQAAEETFKQLAKMPQMGKMTRFSNPSLTGIRQQAIKGFRKYLVFYFPRDEGIEILRVIHGARDIEAILDEDLGEDD
ncbi:MAG TPA: type II toxin-antitoxin system RelE/ParE family toxin [Cyanobacteria bacterium UBA8553]|nr:type II toxin-antitoxin system RelE/ParE family toxin [Cyanobacteria bacterium UBA8553]HAJ62171.1 type II toxin-antitoxin system RelE/ParE family toxin [Cyanobacteria bacterium UBA8543]